MYLKASSIHVIALSIPGINAQAFRAGLVTLGICEVLFTLGK
jgi:hypothetical protein